MMIVISAVMITFCVREWNQYKQCSYGFAGWMVSNWVDLFIISVAADLIDCEGCVPCGFVLGALGLTGYLLINPVLLVLLTLIQISRTTKCIPTNLVFSNYFIIYFNNSVILILACILSVAMISYLRKKKLTEQLRKELDEVYERVFDPTYDVDAFILKYKDTLMEIPFTPKDSALLVDVCTKPYPKNQNDTQEHEKEVCSICLSAFEEQEKILELPGCKHLFHNDCVLKWFEQPDKAPQCPNCKHEVRVSLLTAISLLKKEKKQINKRF